MRVFVTGATGFVGSVIVRELIGKGHTVLGLTRSEAGGRFLEAAGAEVHRGDLDDIESLRSGAAMSDAVIHTAFNHDFSQYVANCDADRRVIECLGAVLAGSDRPLLVTSGTGMAKSVPGWPAREDDAASHSSEVPRAASEEAAHAATTRGANVSVVRLPQVHDPYKQGLISFAVIAAREKGVSAYVGDGQNRWPAVHVTDCARLYVLALEKGQAGSTYHAVAEEGVPVRDIAEIIGRGLKLPVVSLPADEAPGHFGWLAAFAGLDLPASSAQTREQLQWNPTGPTLIADLEQMRWVGE